MNQSCSVLPSTDRRYCDSRALPGHRRPHFSIARGEFYTAVAERTRILETEGLAIRPPPHQIGQTIHSVSVVDLFAMFSVMVDPKKTQGLPERAAHFFFADTDQHVLIRVRIEDMCSSSPYVDVPNVSAF